MVVGIETHVFEVIMFTAGTNAFLCVRSATRGIWALGLSEEDRHELIHPRVREQQIRRVGHQARRLHDRVLLGLKEVEVGLADLRGIHEQKR